jgi:CDP-diacylglycerol--glycerol-3-phosphate 3-phosphatidyltransferase
MKSIYTVPNILTACRFAIVPVLLFMLQPDRGNIVALAAFFLFLSGALTDLADGYLARKYGIESVLGKLMDPLADKMLVATPLIMLLAVTGLRGLAAASGIVVSASGLGKIKSVFQYTALCILIFPLGLLPLPFLHDLGRIILYVSLLLTLWSGFDYFVRLKNIYLTSAPDA